MLLFLFGLCSDVVKVCVLEKIRKLTTAKRMYRVQYTFYERKLVKEILYSELKRNC